GRGRPGRVGRPSRDAGGVRPGRGRGAPAGRVGFGNPTAHSGRAVRELAGRPDERSNHRPGDLGADVPMTGNLLTRYPLFRLLSLRQLDDWLAAGQDIDCPSGFTLFQENTPGAWVHVVRTGRVRIVRQAGLREHSLGVLQPGDVFGEYALLPPGNN